MFQNTSVLTRDEMLTLFCKSMTSTSGIKEEDGKNKAPRPKTVRQIGEPDTKLIEASLSERGLIDEHGQPTAAGVAALERAAIEVSKL